MGWQGGDGGDQSVTDGLGIVSGGEVYQHRVAGRPLDQGGDRGLVGFTHDQIALPMAGYGPILDRGWPVADHHHRINEPLIPFTGDPMRLASGASCPKCLGTSFFRPPRAWKY